MIYFGNNFDFGYDWQLAYSQLLAQFNKLNSDYQKSIDLAKDLQLKILTITTQNQEIRDKKITNSFQTIPNLSDSLLPLHTPSQEQITIKSAEKKRRRIKHQNSIEASQVSPYECVYEDCKRIYKSAVSMNLHIKNKHNGGTKKEREEYAKAIIDAELNGQEPPSVPVTFPPNFLHQFRTTYEYMKKYSM